MTYHHAIGSVDIATSIGASPYRISGDPVTALVAQLNRFAGKTVNMGATCGSNKIVPEPFPLIPSISPKAAERAALIVWRRYNCVPGELKSTQKEQWAWNGFSSQPWSFVMNNLTEITVTLAQYADSLGLEPATVGITEVDQKLRPKFPTMTVVILGAMAVAAFVVSRRKS